MTPERWYCPARDCENIAHLVGSAPVRCPTCDGLMLVVPEWYATGDPGPVFECDACGRPTSRAGFCPACEGHDLSLGIEGGSALRETEGQRW